MTVKLSADPKAKRAKLTEMSKYISRMTDDEKRELIDQCGGVVRADGKTMSLHNSCLALLQDQGCSMLAGYVGWQKLGRQVIKGAKSIGVWVPSGAKNDDGTPDFFMFRPVFDISQTEPIKQNLK